MTTLFAREALPIMDAASWSKLQDEITSRMRAFGSHRITQAEFRELFAILNNALDSHNPPSSDTVISIHVQQIKDVLVFPAGRYPGISLQVPADADSRWQLTMEACVFTGHFTLVGGGVASLRMRDCEFDSLIQLNMDNNNYRYPLELTLEDVQFHGRATIQLANRDTTGLLDNVEFLDGAVVHGGSFLAKCNCLTFGSYLEFNDSKIQGDSIAMFANRRLRGPASFNGVYFPQGANFQRTVFEGDVYFDRCNAGSDGRQHHDFDFTRAKFEGRADFNNPDAGPISRSIRFHAAKFRHPPKISPAFGSVVMVGATFTSHLAEDYPLYHRLRQTLEAQHEHDEASAMFAHEQRAHANYVLTHLPRSVTGTVSTFGYWMVIKLYIAFSDTGHDFVRPLLWAIGLNTAAYFGLAYLSSSTVVKTLSPPSILWLQNIFAPFSFITRVASGLPLTPGIVAISLLQSIGTVLFLALALLAVRRRFKKVD